MATTFWIDRIACDGFGMCAELVPELITLDDWGFPIIRPGPIPDRLLDHAQRAVQACPVLALRLQQVAAAGTAPEPARAGAGGPPATIRQAGRPTVRGPVPARRPGG